MRGTAQQPTTTDGKMSFLSVRRKSSRHFSDTSSEQSAGDLTRTANPPTPPVPALPPTSKAQLKSTGQPVGTASDPILYPKDVSSSSNSPLPSPQAPSSGVKRGKRVPPPSLGLEEPISLNTPPSTYTSRLSGAAFPAGAGPVRGRTPFDFPSPSSAAHAAERPRYVLEVAPLSLTRSGTEFDHDEPDNHPSSSFSADQHAGSSMSMLRTPTASSTRSASSRAPSGYGYGGEYNSAWAESPKLGLGHPPASPGLSPGPSPGLYRQPSGLGESGEYGSYEQRGASRTSSYSSAQVKGRGKEVEGDERVAYTYALRVAALQEHLANPPSSHPPSPSPPPTPPSPRGSTPGSDMTRRKSSFGFLRRDSSSSSAAALGGKGDETVIKMPKEFLVEFWQILAQSPGPASMIGQDGEHSWNVARSGFLKGIKKGSRNEGGGNLRDVGVLLETFTSYLPSDPQTIGQQHKYATHLLALLSAALPRSSYFSPMAKQLNEKDKKLLHDIKNEIQTYSLPSNERSNGASKASALGYGDESAVPPVPTATAATNAKGPGLPASANGQVQGMLGAMQKQTQNIKRKPSPGSAATSSDGLVATVGYIFGVRREVWEGDLEDFKSVGSLEEMYMHDLLLQLHQINSLSHPTNSQRQRSAYLQTAQVQLQRSFPQLSTTDESFSNSSDLFFTPPTRANVLSRLSTRASENITLDTRARELVMSCRDMWGVGNLRDKEREVESLMASWCGVMTTGCAPKEEMALGIALCEGVDDLVTQSSASYAETGERPRVLSELGETCIKLLDRSTESLWTNTAHKATRPPPSLLPLLAAANGAIWADEAEQKALQDVVDGIKANAVGEYVRVLSEMGGMGESAMGMGMNGAGAKGGAAPGYAAVGRWIEEIVRAARKAWGEGLGSTFDPAAIILSKQLPLFFAEMQMLDDEPSEQVVGLYKVVVGLCDLWDDLCPDADHGFEAHAFFDPFVRGWIKQVAESQVQIWVSRAVGMDNWTLSTDESDEDKHSQSVDDLFESLSQATTMVLSDIPVGGTERQGLLADMAKAISLAMKQYASTVEALYDAEVSPDKLAQAYHFNSASAADGGSISPPAAAVGGNVNANAAKFAGKASGWLSKGQQAVKGLEKKTARVDGFVIPPTACVKLANMSAADRALDELGDKLLMDTSTIRAMAESSVIGSPGSAAGRRALPGPAAFTITILGGENLHTKQGKSVEAFVVVAERETGERVLKTRTVPGDGARWHESLECSITRPIIYDVTVYDRSLVGKHDMVASGPLNIDPKTAAGTRSVLLPLQPQGMLRLSIATDGGEKREVRPYIDAASALLERTESKMAFGCLERMMDFIKDQLSNRALSDLTRPNKGKPAKKLGMGMGMGGAKEQKVAPEQFDIEASLGELFAHFNANFAAFSTYLSPPTRHSIMLALWHRVLEHLISLLVPPLSDLPSRAPLLCPQESDIVFKWLQLIKVFFNAKEDDGTEYGIPLAELTGGRYKDLIMLGQYLDLPSPSLRERVVASVKAVGLPGGGGAGGVDGLSRGMGRLGVESPTAASTTGSGLGSGHGSYGTGGPDIGQEERSEGERMAEILLRIARTRSDQGDVLGQQVGQYNNLRLKMQGAR